MQSTGYVSFYNQLVKGSGTKMSRGLVLEGLCEKPWNFNTLSLSQQSHSSSVNIFEKETDPTFPQRPILTHSWGTAPLPVSLDEKVCQLTGEVSRRLQHSLVVS